MSSFNSLENISSHSNSRSSRLTSHSPKSIQFSPQTIHNCKQVHTSPNGASAKGDAVPNKKLIKAERSRLSQWFYNLPVRQKILLGLTVPGIFTIFGLISMQYQLFMGGAHTHLVKQAKLELAVIEDEYNHEIEQMRVSAQGRAENPIIVTALQDHTVNPLETPATRETVKEILRKEASELGIEFATLVSRDLRIVANINGQQMGKIFNPDKLVSTVLTDRRQISTNTVLQLDNLAGAFTPSVHFNRSDTLIRYTATPVIAPENQEVLGVLVLGDIVNDQLPIVKKTVDILGGGYSGVYMVTPDGELTLAVSADQDSNDTEMEINEDAYDLPFIKTVVEHGGIVTKRVQEEGESFYVMAAKPILDFRGKPVAVLVRGTSELDIGGLVRDEVLIQFVFGGGLVMFNLFLATVLGGFITRPLKGLQKAAHLFAAGNRWIRSKAYAKDEVGQLAVEFNQLADSVMRSENRLRKQAKQQAAKSQTIRLILEEVARTQVQTEHEIEEVFKRAITAAQKILTVDRLFIYHVGHDGRDCILTEAVSQTWTHTRKDRMSSPCHLKLLHDAFINSRTTSPHGSNDNISPDLPQLMGQLQIKATLAEPILHEGLPFGLLISQHCSPSHEYTPFEIDFVRQLAVQLGVALDRLSFLQKQEAEANRSHVLGEINRQILSAQTSIEVVARLPLTQIRQVLSADRVLLYQFDQNGESTVTAKSVSKGWLRALNAQTYAPYLTEGDVDQYRNGHIQTISNIYQASLSCDRINHLETFAIKANLVAPIRLKNHLFGLLIAHQCEAPRIWKPTETSFFQQAATQVELALERCELLSQREIAAEHARTLANQQHQQQEQWRRRLTHLLSEVSQATVAAQDINHIVETIQSEVTQLIKAMEGDASQTEKEALRVGNAIQSLEKLQTVLHQINQLAQSNSEIGISQKSTARTVKRLLQEINPEVVQSSVPSEESTQSLQKTVQKQ
ncbi:MAG: GAF domain-containing protein [Leptolyngbyaceae cyanobacterium MO_188.B28]|nr:GAF domain-containing protein [Leptolyngbyaceae cyanobacterium MO_188.B28]